MVLPLLLLDRDSLVFPDNLFTALVLSSCISISRCLRSSNSSLCFSKRSNDLSPLLFVRPPLKAVAVLVHPLCPPPLLVLLPVPDKHPKGGTILKNFACFGTPLWSGDTGTLSNTRTTTPRVTLPKGVLFNEGSP